MVKIRVFFWNFPLFPPVLIYENRNRITVIITPCVIEDVIDDLFAHHSSVDSEDSVVIEAENSTTNAPNQTPESKESPVVVDGAVAAAATTVDNSTASGASWFKSLDKETRQQLAETRKVEGNQLFAKACFQQATKKYAEVTSTKTQ